MANESGSLVAIDSTLPFKQVILRFDNFLVDDPDSASISFQIGWDSDARDPLVDNTTGAFVTDPPREFRTVAASSTLLSFSLRPTIDSGGQGRHLVTLDGETVSYYLTVILSYPGDGPDIPIVNTRRFDVDFEDSDPIDLGVQWETA